MALECGRPESNQSDGQSSQHPGRLVTWPFFQSSILKSCVQHLFREKGDEVEGKLLVAMAQLRPHKQPGADMYSEFISIESSLASPSESYFLSQRICKSLLF